MRLICNLCLICFFIVQSSVYSQINKESKETGGYYGGYGTEQTPAESDESIADTEMHEIPSLETENVNQEPVESSLDKTGGAAEATFSYGSSGSSESSFQNAIIEGIQLTAEPGTQPDEKIIAGYFIFRDKPSSYFYEVKLREKKLIFEFNDTRVGSSPVPSASEPPIKGFVIEQGKIDVNKAVKGLKPEWHDYIRVVFDLEAVPDIHVNDEYSLISFSFKWTTDPAKQIKYIVKDKTPKIILWSTAGVGGVALGTVAYFFLRPPQVEKPLAPLPYDDLPQHTVGE